MFAAGVSMREMDPSTSFGAFISPEPPPGERGGRKPGGAVAAIMGHFSRSRGLMPGQFATPTRQGLWLWQGRKPRPIQTGIMTALVDGSRKSASARSSVGFRLTDH